MKSIPKIIINASSLHFIIGSDKSSVELLPPSLFIASSVSPDSSINCFVETFFSGLDFFSSCLHLTELNTFCKYS